MSDPTTVTHAQVRAAYDALGLDPGLWNDTRLIDVTPHEVHLTRYVRNARGHTHMDADGLSPVTEVVTIPIDWSDR